MKIKPEDRQYIINAGGDPDDIESYNFEDSGPIQAVVDEAEGILFDIDPIGDTVVWELEVDGNGEEDNLDLLVSKVHRLLELVIEIRCRRNEYHAMWWGQVFELEREEEEFQRKNKRAS